MTIIRLLKLYILLLCCTLVYGCSTVDEDLTGCEPEQEPEIEIRLVYVDHLEVDFTEADFIAAIDFAEVYIFDNDLKLVELIRVEDYQMEDGHIIKVPYSYLGCTVVAYAREMKGSYTVPVLNIGDHIDLLTLTLNTTKNSLDENVSDKDLADLFHGGRHILTLPEGELIYTIKFLRDDKIVNISLRDKLGNNLDMSKYDVRLNAMNSYYLNDNSVVPNSPEVTYLAYKHTATTRAGDASEVGTIDRLHSLRLKARYKGYVKMTIRNKETGELVPFGNTTDLKLVEHLLIDKPASLTDQEYLDKRHIWDVSFLVDTDRNLALNIVVNGWTTWFSSSDLK